MFLITQSFLNFWRKFLSPGLSVYIALCCCILPLFLFNSHQNSLMAHDEGLYAWRAKMMVDTGDWIHPWPTPHHKTPGPYWLIAAVYTVFGINEFSVRLPSLVLGFLSMILVYEIGRIILKHHLAFLATVILSLEFLWLQYCRLGNPDIPMIFLVLLAIFCLLKAESSSKNHFVYITIAGFALGLGFLVRSLMMVLPIVALLPYLMKNVIKNLITNLITNQNRQQNLFKPLHQPLRSPYLYLGFLIGLIPTLIWLYLNIQHYGITSLNELLGFAVRLGSNERGGNGILFYVWNVPLKSFPWGLWAIAGGIICFRHPISPYNSLLLGFPITLFLELSLVSTRLSHYSLLLYPFIAFFAAVGLDRFIQTFYLKPSYTRLLSIISYGTGIFAIICFVAGIITLVIAQPEIHKYAIIAIAFGIGCCILPLVWQLRDRFPDQHTASKYWLAGLLIPFWLGLASVGMGGFINDYNPHIKQLVTQPLIAQILQRHPINFVKIGGKTGVLLNFYTPRHGRRSDNISELPHNSYAWVNTKDTNISIPSHRLIGGTRNYSLIQIQRPVVLGERE